MTTAPERPVTAGSDPSLAHLLGRVGIVGSRVRRAVEARRNVDPDPDDRFRGLYITDAHVDALLDGDRPPLLPGLDDGSDRDLAILEAHALDAEAAGARVALHELARSFGLDAIDVELLLVAIAPDIDARYERLYAYLQDDVSRRRASIGLALELCGTPAGAPGARRRLGPMGPLVAGGLVLVEEPERPFLTRSLRVPDRVTAHLLGDDTPEPWVEALVLTPAPVAFAERAVLERALRDGCRLAYLREPVGGAGEAMAADALAAVGLGVVVIDLRRLAATEPARELAEAVIREARLRGAGLVAGPVDALADRHALVLSAFAEAACPVLLVGSRSWDPAWSREVPLLIDAPVPSLELRGTLWSAALDAGGDAPVPLETDLAAFRLSPEQVVRATRAARQQAAAEGRPVGAADLRTGARSQNAGGLERLARRIRPQVEWDDLVLPGDVLVQLREIAERARFRDVVLDRWALGRRSSKGRGLTALFAGDSGTGKTMSAEVVAGELGLDLYVIDLSTVIDKYIGETEKNLDRIFAEADRVNGVLLFDEADAIFGKRSDVKDSHDRYANVEVAYLLQRMELFDGVAILTTNLRSNVDEAFTRRLDSVIDFPMPEDDDRLRLWRKNLPDTVPQDGDLDLEFLARAFKLSGGNIRNVCVAAAFFAAAEDRRVRMADLIRATEREYRKLGRLTVEAEFGRYFELLTAE
jgi:ATPase family associated with various cellular activities (AAA)